MHVQAAHFPFAPLWHHLVGRAVSPRVRLLDRARSGRAVLFEGARISFAKSLLPGCIMHIWAAHFLFDPLWHIFLVGRIMSRRVRLPARARLGRAVSFEGTHISFAKL